MTTTPHMDRLEREFAQFFGRKLLPPVAPPEPLGYQAIADVEAGNKGAHDDDRR